jgi:excisionase family DNA binding protein
MTKKLTLDEAAALLGFSPKTVYNWTCKKKIPHLKLGGRLRFDENDLEAWLVRHRVGPDVK